MARMKRNTMLDGIFLDIASPEDIKTVDRLYSIGNKGSAIALQLRRIIPVWIDLMRLKDEQKTKESKELEGWGYAIPKML